MAASFLTLLLPDEAATAAFAEDVAAILGSGDVIALSGGLGAGKTTFARALIRALADDAALEVPSPTFTLVQTYAAGRLTVAHFDLYRLGSADELDEIGLADAVSEGAALIEWPERGDGRLPEDRLDIRFEIEGDGRRAELSGSGDWRARIERTRAVRALIDEAGFSGASRRFLQGDGSTRRFERVRKGAATAVLMDWERPPAPPVRDSRAAFRAQTVEAVLAVDAALQAIGLSVPAIIAADREAGLLLMEDFGSQGVLVNGAPDPERYGAAIDVLAAIHAAPRAAVLPVPGGGEHRLLNLSAQGADGRPRALRRLVRAACRRCIARPFRSRIVCCHLGRPLRPARSRREELGALRHAVAQPVLAAGARWGRPASVSSIFRTCSPVRPPMTWPRSARMRVSPSRPGWRRRSATATSHSGARQTRTFDVELFAGTYAILGAARTLKNMGVFARLADHLGKTQYLQHLPRMDDYLARSLKHPVLSDLAVWYERHLPPLSQAHR